MSKDGRQSVQLETRPVEDSIAKVNNEIAVGSDMQFQAKWWAFEKVIWVVFTLIVIAALAGLLGRGPLAKAHLRTADGSLAITYERIARFSTPSILTVKFGRAAIHDGGVQLWTDDGLLTKLGNHRIAPQPQRSSLVKNGALYTFDAADDPGPVEFMLEPATIGLHEIRLQVPGFQEVRTSIFVMP